MPPPGSYAQREEELGAEVDSRQLEAARKKQTLKVLSPRFGDLETVEQLVEIFDFRRSGTDEKTDDFREDFVR